MIISFLCSLHGACFQLRINGEFNKFHTPNELIAITHMIKEIQLCFMRIYDNENVEHKKAISIHHVTTLRRVRMAHLFCVNVVLLQRLSGSLATSLKNNNHFCREHK